MKPRHLLATAAALPLAILALGFGLACAAGRPDDLGLVDGRLRPCPTTPNCVCSESDDASIAPFELGGEPDDDPDAAFQALLRVIAAYPRAEIVEARDDYAYAEFRTRFFHFTDDLELRLDREQRRIHVRSASRVGYSDLGANRARVEALRQRWNASRSGPQGDGNTDGS